MTAGITRDLVGYGKNPPKVSWPDDAKVALSIVVNIEEGSEFAVSDGDDHSEGVGELPGQMEPGYPDLTNESIYEYGSRVGVWRVLDVLDRYNAPATFFTCGRVMERYPELMREIDSRGHELISHGWRWEEHFKLDEETERERIRLTIEAFEKTIGRRPLGWYCRYAHGPNTRRLLVDEGGFRYDSDAYNDDLPFYDNVDGTPFLVVPYNLDINDIRYWLGPALFTSSDFADYCIESLDQLVVEGATTPRMTSVGIHPRIIGRPGRIRGFERIVKYAMESPDVWVARRIEIADVWTQQFPAPIGASS